MAHQEQVKLLQASVKDWNKWRRTHPRELVDLTNANLSGANLSKANLTRANLGGAILDNADLTWAKMDHAILTGDIYLRTKLDRAKLIDADLTHAHLEYASLNNADLLRAKLDNAILDGARLDNANLVLASLYMASLHRASLVQTNFSHAILTRTNFSGANLNGAILNDTSLVDAILIGAHLGGAFLVRADLSNADLTKADLMGSIFTYATVSNATISGSRVFGVNVWDLKGEFKEQKDLVITPEGKKPITVDNFKVAQFVYLILNNEEIRDVINTLTSKTVLILGRFSPERKVILDTLRNKLREYDLLPIVFDFDRPINQDFTETIKTLASISYFVIADVTNPKSSPLELQATVPDYQIPFVPIIQEGEKPFAMMANLKTKYSWVLDTISYDSLDTLMEILKPHIIDPAIKKRDELRLIKAQEPTVISGRELRNKGKA